MWKMADLSTKNVKHTCIFLYLTLSNAAISFLQYKLSWFSKPNVHVLEWHLNQSKEQRRRFTQVVTSRACELFIPLVYVYYVFHLENVLPKNKIFKNRNTILWQAPGRGRELSGLASDSKGETELEMKKFQVRNVYKMKLKCFNFKLTIAILNPPISSQNWHRADIRSFLSTGSTA